MKRLITLLLIATILSACATESTNKKAVTYNDLVVEFRNNIYNKELRPDSAITHFHIGNTLLKKSYTAGEKAKKFNIEQAISEYQKAIEIDPTYAPIFYSLGLAYIQNNDQAEAIEALEKSLELNPEFFDAYLALAITFEKRQDADDAIRNYQEAIKIKPEDTRAKILLGNLYFKEGNYEQSEELFNKVKDLNPKNQIAIFALDKIKEKQKAGKKAKRDKKIIPDVEASEDYDANNQVTNEQTPDNANNSDTE